MTKPAFIPYSNYSEYPVGEMKRRSAEFYTNMSRRRTIRDFSNRPVPQEIIDDCILAAGTAPSGANLQPWHFVVVSDKGVKSQIRQEAENEERRFYQGRASKEWLEALGPLGTDEHKPFLETAPILIVIFAQNYGLTCAGDKVKHYYVAESVGIATGLLIAAIHQAGLVSLTHTPNPMKFLNEICARPPNERPFAILVVGYPSDDAVVPSITKKPLNKIASFM